MRSAANFFVSAMTSEDIAKALEEASSSDNFPLQSAELVEQWTAANVGLDAVDLILRFMEDHPAIDYGATGALVHFAEQFYTHGYEEKLLNSILRKPVVHTVSMLNALINATKIPDLRRRYLMVLEQARSHPLVDQQAKERIDFYLDRHRNGKRGAADEG